MALYFIGVVSIGVIYSDCRYRHISNKICAIIFFTSLYVSIERNNIPTSLFSCFIVFLSTAMLFKFNIMGAGDSKLATAFSIALLPSEIVDAAMLVLFLGGLLALFYLIKDRLILKLSREHERGLPYGVAISFGFYITIINSLI
nr:A24 family peptidase [Moritella sp. 24]